MRDEKKRPREREAADETIAVKQALRKARREERLTEAALHRKRAEIAQLIALGQEAEAQRLLATLNQAEQSRTTQPPQAEKPRTQNRRPQEQRPAAATLKKAQGAKTRTGSEPVNRSKSPVAKPTRPSKPRPASTRKVQQPAKVKPTAKPKRTRWRRKTIAERWTLWIGKQPPWAVSAVAHGLLLAAFALLTFASFQEPNFSLTASFADDAWDEPLTEVQLVDWQEATEAEAPAIELMSDLVFAAELEVAPDVLDPVTTEPVLIGELPSDPSSLMAPSGAAEKATGTTDGESNSEGAGEGESETEKPAGPPGRVSFFGAEARGNRVVFVVDNSGSMQRGRMETALAELERSVRKLSVDQEFYVLFYSDQAYPMFYPEPIHELLPATRDNKRRLSKWLDSVEMCLGGRLLDAVDLAATLDPELVFLLSDGDIRSQRVMASLTDPEAWPFTIHTLGMGARSKQHAANLMQIAEANEGGYLFVDAHPTAVRRSFAKPLRYHRTPGETWGSAVQPWK